MLEIEITQTNIIEGGIEVFARAWEDGVQIGFSKDGSVDIERFRLMVGDTMSYDLVPDPLGDISFLAYDGDGYEETMKFRSDPEEAVLRRLEKVIQSVGVKDATITAGKIGNTTTIVDANLTNSKYTQHDAASGTYNTNANIATANSAVSNLAGGGLHNAVHDSKATTFYLRYADVQFDTSGLPDGDDVTACTFTANYTTAGANNDGYTCYFLDNTNNVALTDPLVKEDQGDFEDTAANAIGSETFATLDADSVITTTINSFAWIDKTGTSRLGARSGNVMLEQLDGSATEPTSWNNLRWDTATDTPYLTITHEAGSTPQSVTASATAAASIAATTSYYRALTASITAAATVSKGFTAALTASISAAATIASQSISTVSLTASIAAATTITNVKSFYRTLTGSATGAATITNVKSFYRTLVASATAAATIVASKTFYQTLTAAITAAATTANGGAIRTVILTAYVAAKGKLNELFYKKKYTKEDEDYKRKY